MQIYIMISYLLYYSEESEDPEKKDLLAGRLGNWILE